jgi:major vault protein
MADENRNDLVLSPNEYAYVLDTTKGQVGVYVGPHKTSLSNSDRLVKFNSDTKRFEHCDYKNAVTLFEIVPEGWYSLLKNPEESNKHPQAGSVTNAPDTIKIGEKVNIKGPCSFALYPGQMAQTIQGHTLRSNQYLLVRVYDADAANKTLDKKQKPYVTGNLLIIRGTKCSFYIPETGFEVIPTRNGDYVRDAVTLERLEYCILKDEDGNKRYVHGPAVVFPEPTETFLVKDNSIKYKAIELSEISGVYVKVIADYTDEDSGKEYKTGEELFITGKDQMIYYPRPEHALISYDGNNVYHAIAIPKGEGRYVMNRQTGDIRTVKGPSMFLPDPRHEVLVNRKLSKTECELWYPGNKDVLNYNVGYFEASVDASACVDSLTACTARSLTASLNYADATPTSVPSKSVFEDSAFNRKNNYTKPRSITFDNKYDGVVSIDVWTGYAVNVVSKDGTRRVVCGPQTVILDYDQVLEAMSLSTGKPKTTDRILRTVYLRYKNNKVSDIIDAETNDFIPVKIKVSYDVDFDEQAMDKWFAVENYIKLLCDKIRSDVKRGIKNYSIQKFYNNYSDIVHSLIMNEKESRVFEDNGMILKDVNVLSIDVDAEIKDMLEDNQRQMIRNMLNNQRDQANFERQKKIIELKMEIADMNHQSAMAEMEIKQAQEKKSNEIVVAQNKFEAEEQIAKLEAKREQDVLIGELAAKKLERENAEDQQRLAIRDKEIAQKAAEKKTYAETVASIMESISPDFIAAMQANSNAETLQIVAEAMAPLAIAKGEGVADTVNTLMRGTSLENVIAKIKNHSDD